MIVAKEKPKWYQFRYRLSNVFVNIARKIYLDSDEVKAFYLQLIQDQFMYGQSIVRINPVDFYSKKDNLEEK